MASLIVGGITVPVAPGGISRDRLDWVDRSRAFDGTYRASATGNPKREWSFSTPPITRANADFYEVLLGNVSAKACSGDILGGSNNLYTYSEELNNAAWTKVDVTVSADTAVAPDGSTTADAILETATTNDHYLYQASTGTSGVRHALSSFLHKGGRTWAALFVATGGVAKAWFDLTNGVVGTVSGTGSPTASILSIGSDWFRCTLTGLLPSSGAFNAGIAVATADNISSYLGTGGTGILSWGEQLEPASVATPYIKTTTVPINSLSVNCCSEITGWSPVRTSDGHRVVLGFSLHEV